MHLKTLQLKRALHRLLLVIMLSAMEVTEVFAALATIGDLTYSLDFNTLTATVTRHKDGSDATGTLTIPESVTYLGLSFSVTSIGRSAFFPSPGLTGDLIIPNSVITIEEMAFDNCMGFTGTLSIPNSVTTIGDHAFNFCTGFTGNLIIGNSVISIGDNAFSGCSGFTGNLILGNSVTTIGNSAFTLCSGFTGILTIPNSVTTIGNSAFSGCSGFIGDIVIPNSVTTIGNFAFSGCSSFTGNLILGNSLTTIGKYAFCDCSGLIGNLIIPNSVSTIGECAFEDCNSFNGSLTIGSSVTTIDAWAFYGCNNIMEINVLGITPPSLEFGIFYAPNDCPIYVPYESLNAYKTATIWHDFEVRIFPIAYTTVLGYGEGNGNYRFIASPLVEDTDPTTVNNLITETDYDLYCFNQSEELEWQNFKVNFDNFIIANGQGYLYANAEDVNLIFKGTFNEDETKTVDLAYDQGMDNAGWNLVGNPFPVEAYANKSYYTLSNDGSTIEPNTVSSQTIIPVCTGIMVKAEGADETIIFSKETQQSQNNGMLQVAVSQSNQSKISTGSVTSRDNAIVSFNAEDALEKFVFNADNPQLYIPLGGKEFAIAYTEQQGEMPLNFKAKENGEYTISVTPQGVEMGYLHLIDNLTGADVDLLATSTSSEARYTFTARTTDYASRFKLVFSANNENGASTGSTAFAYYNGSGWVVNVPNEATVQVVDMMGRIIVSTDGRTRYVPTAGMPPGMYVLRLIDRKDVKTQKIVIE